MTLGETMPFGFMLCARNVRRCPFGQAIVALNRAIVDG
jgi:hypothetical protein